MEYQHLIEKTQNIEAIFPKVFDLFEQEIQQLKNKHFLDSAASLSAAFERIDKEGRLLNLGIVGRVKAGKSSLLNALFFEGKPVLPKAATPMTAALTTLTYAEKFRVSIEFFTAEDIKNLEINAKHFEHTLNQIKKRKYEEFSSRQSPSASTTLDEDRLSEVIKKQAITEMQSTHPELCASFDQYERMKKSGLTLAELENVNVIEPESQYAFSSQLLEYVGADGKYMPFTKLVNISMPLDSLRGICVIDTPGMNDPVQSREARTVELLKSCDVIFIVSPAGQFINDNDLDLMSRITAKEGVQELMLIASQIDTQLYGSEKLSVLKQSIEKINVSLAHRAKTTLTSLKRTNPEIGTVFDKIIHNPERYLMHSSGVAHSIHQHLETPDEWDANEKKTWENLTCHYDDYFSMNNPGLTRNSLAALANIDNIHSKINEVRQMKDEIIRHKMSRLIESKNNVLTQFTEDLLKLIEQRIVLINSTDLGALAKQSQTLFKQRNVLDKKLNQAYSHCITSQFLDVQSELNNQASKLFIQTRQSIEDQSSTETKREEREKSGVGNWIARKFWGGGVEKCEVTRTTIHTGQVSVSIKNFIHSVEENLRKVASQQQGDLDRKLSNLLTPIVKDTLEDECDVSMIADAILSVIDQIRPVPFLLNITIPTDLKPQGKLKGTSADEYIDHAENFIAITRSQIFNDIRDYFNRIQNDIPPGISTIFVEQLDSKINQIINQVENSKQTIERLQRFSSQIQDVR